MDSLISAIQDVVTTEPETEVQPDPTQPADATIETQLSEEISTLWTEHTRLSADRKVTAKELRRIRANLAERLAAMKSMLSRPGRGGLWRSWLRERGIPRSTADGLISRCAENMSADVGNVPSRAISEPGITAAEKLAKVVWSRFGKLLSTDESVILFIGQIAELSGVGHEQRAEGLLIFSPAPKAAEGLAGSATASVPVQEPSDEALAVVEQATDENATAPTEIGLVVEAADASNGVAA